MDFIENYLAAIILLASGIIFIVRTLKDPKGLSVVSWTAWAIIGIAFMIGSYNSGNMTVFWATVGGSVCPIVVSIILIRVNRKEKQKIIGRDWFCGISALVSIFLSFVVPEEFVFIGIVLAIIADFASLTPTLGIIWKDPMADRPFAWFLFSVGYSVAFYLKLGSHWSELLIPGFMPILSSLVWIPMVVKRIENKTPLKEWF